MHAVESAVCQASFDTSKMLWILKEASTYFLYVFLNNKCIYGALYRSNQHQFLLILELQHDNFMKKKQHVVSDKIYIRHLFILEQSLQTG